MSEHGRSTMSDALAAEAEAYPHLAEHLSTMWGRYGEYPVFTEELTDEFESDAPNVLYPAGRPIFIHVYGDVGVPTTYHCVEPTLDDDRRAVYDAIRERILDRSVVHPTPESDEEFDDRLGSLLDEVVSLDRDRSLRGRIERRLLGEQIPIDEEEYERIQYQLERDIVGLGPLAPVMRDDNNEDIHVIGPEQCYVDHGIYSMLGTTVEWRSAEAYDNWLRNMGERMDNPVSDSRPIVDSTLPNGSRINIVYSDDVSVQGPSLTIRQGDEVPLSILQITAWGTLSPELAAYLWLCMENERTVFVVGETASGKTTTLNSMLSFIPRDAKIYTAEDTAEVVPPHDTWQQLLTRESQGDESADVDMFDLVAAALRSRPDYIIVGEVRGAEGQMAFQAAQTGHPVILTFHASDIVSMIQRFTGEPINVPETFMDNCDVALFQNRVKQGDDVLRRVTSVQEIEGYSEHAGGVVTRQAFSWDPVDDEIVFEGRNNSYVLEEQIATLLGYDDSREIYDELQYRADIIRQLIDADVLGYAEVNEAIAGFQRDGVTGLPIDVNERQLGGAIGEVN